MTTPSAEQVKVATDALRAEATIWDDQSDQMDKVSTKVENMQLGRIEAGVFQLIVGPYNEMVQTVTQRCDEATVAMNNIGDTLRAVARSYDDEDAAGEHRIRGIY